MCVCDRGVTSVLLVKSCERFANTRPGDQWSSANDCNVQCLISPVLGIIRKVSAVFVWEGDEIGC